MSGLKVAAIVPLMMLAAAAPAGWVARPGQGDAEVFDSQTSPNTSIMLFPAYSTPGFGPEMLRQIVGKLPFCPRAGPVEQPAGEGSLRLIAGGADRNCIAEARRLPSGDWRISLGMAVGHGAMAQPALLSAVGQLTGSAAPGAAPPLRVAAAGPSATGSLPRPIGAVMHGKSGFIGYPPMVTFTNTPWFLFPGGVATDCTQVDPATPPTLAGLRARKDCTGARWRRAGANVELQIEDGDAWVSDMVHELPPVPRGTRLDFRGQTKSGAGFDNPGLSTTTSSTSYGAFVMTQNGRIETSMSSSVNFSSSNVVAYAGGANRGVRGRYEIDGYVLRIALDEGRTIERYVLFDKGGKPTFGHVYFERRQYWLPSR